jgi:hypothetical protein
MGSAAGILKTAAARTGLGVDEYTERVSKGLLYCWRCREWHDADEFGKDSSRWSGRASSCRRSRGAAISTAYKPKPEPSAGRRYVEARDGDYKQARGRVNHLVNMGLLPDPNDVPCTDCGHVFKTGERRHEYDHHHGYGAEHHECVESVCTTCHHARENARRDGSAPDDETGESLCPTEITGAA